ncbi:hypothetical protein [Streptomyces sp. DH12]|uniref:hypothetical protein n=1 Tax=Streptomyces sp. DH12 TaxID=2857010 RepID=UPI001E4A3D0F|nr:hypothetical protein [Streptomyces sp. DH12]
MKQRIEFTGAVDVYTDKPLTLDAAARWVEVALLRGDKHADSYVSWLEEVVHVNEVDDDA